MDLARVLLPGQKSNLIQNCVTSLSLRITFGGPRGMREKTHSTQIHLLREFLLVRFVNIYTTPIVGVFCRHSNSVFSVVLSVPVFVTQGNWMDEQQN